MRKSIKIKNGFFSNLALFLVILIGLSLLLVPTIENRVLTKKQEIIMSQLSDFSNGPVKKRESNKLSVSQNELGKPLAILIIPSLNLKLPVYNSTSNEVLVNGIGLFRGTGKIEGGIGTNPTLFGHNGESTANLFTHLPNLQKKDKFFIKIGNTYHEYNVFSKTLNVTKENFTTHPELYLMPKKDKDWMTLVTCFPRYDNSRRAILKGERIPFNKNDLLSETKKTHDRKDSTIFFNKYKKIIELIVAIVILVGLISLLVRIMKRPKRLHV